MSRISLALLYAIGLSLALSGCSSSPSAIETTAAPATRTIIFVWDGLRPDSVTQAETPNLWELKSRGTWFADNHSTFPTFTMMNASAFATGSFPATTGFYGNTLWRPAASGANMTGRTVDFTQPAYTEDFGVIQDLDASYQKKLYLVRTLFQTAQAKGLVTATVGKSGASFIQDYKRGSFILDENIASPISLAQDLQRAGFALPKNSVNGYPSGLLRLSPNNGDPTAQAATVILSPNMVGSDPTDGGGAKATSANQYMLGVYLNYILPIKRPDLSVIWFRDPDTTQHAYGPGSRNAHLALQAQDARLGELVKRLVELKLDKTTNIIVVSDHSHSSVSGSLSLFPLRAIVNRVPTGIDRSGFSVSGDVRTADLLSREHLGIEPFDGNGCATSVLAGTKADGSLVYPLVKDELGAACGKDKAGTFYQTPSYVVPKVLPTNAVVIAANGGSDYLYVPSHDPAIVARLVHFLQVRSEYGAVFVADRYGRIDGTLPLSIVRVEGASQRNPDIVVSFDFDEAAVVAGMPGTEYGSFFGNRGMHGSFSPVDVHNTLIAAGPSFKAGTSTLPSGNVDVAPTVAYILGARMPDADGRILAEALVSAPAGSEVSQVIPVTLRAPGNVTGLKFQLPSSPDGADIDDQKRGTYSMVVRGKDVTTGAGKTYRYFDQAKAWRQ